MAVSLIFDDTSLVLTLAILLLLSLTIYIGKAYQPLIHPLILSRQSDVSPIRHKGQSAIYRNASSPAGVELASRPRRKINGVLDALRYGSDAPQWSLQRKRLLYGVQKSNQDIIEGAQGFARGLAAVNGLEGTSELGLLVCVDQDSLPSFQVLISGCIQETASQVFSPLVVSPDFVDQGQIPSTLPKDFPAKRIHAVFSSVNALSSALKLSNVDNKTIFILATEKDVQQVQDSTSNKVMHFDEVIASSSSMPSSEKVEKVERTGQSVQSIYWTGKAGWINAKEQTLIAAITAYFGLFPAQSQPGTEDHIYVATSQTSTENQGTSSPNLSAVYHPAGLVLPLLALYSGAAFTSSQLTSTSSSNSTPNVKPTLLFTSPSGASTLAMALCNVSRRNLLIRPAVNNKLAFLRHGTFSQSSLWDKMVFEKVRSSLNCQDLRSLLILSEGSSVNQELLDVLRAHLSCAVRQAYLPSSPCSLLGSELTAGIGIDTNSSALSAALVTSPLTAVHSLDLQAFAEEGGYAPAHVGPPTVTIEIKLVETSLAKRLGFGIDGDSTKDPSGEILVRGSTISGGSDAKQWCATGDMGSFRSNGTLIVLHDHNQSKPVYVPSISSSKTTTRTNAVTHRTPLISLLTLLLCFLCSNFVEAGIPEGRFPLASLPPSADLHKRADEINSTMAETAIMGFLTSPRSAWEQGCSQSALLEYYAGPWSVFTATKGGPPYNQSSSSSEGFPSQLLSMAYSSVRTQDTTGKLCTYVTGNEVATVGSALDPASCGEAVLLAGYISGDIGDGTVLNANGIWITAAQRQLDYVLNVVPKGTSGIISMKSDRLAYWSDALYMLPPFLALYGLLTRNQTLLQESYNQISYYRDELLIGSGPAEGLLQHIVNGSDATGTGNDRGAWLTGNGWAAAGMVKVIASIVQSEFASEMEAEVNDLVTWTQAILDGCYRNADPLISNYVNDTTTFRDAGGSSLIAYATYRLSSLSPTKNSAHLDAADAIYAAVQSSLTPLATFDSNLEVVNALTFDTPTQTSPESLAFLVLLSSAKRDHQQGNVTGIEGITTGYAGSSTRLQRRTSSTLLFTATSSLLALLFT